MRVSDGRSLSAPGSEAKPSTESQEFKGLTTEHTELTEIGFLSKPETENWIQPRVTRFDALPLRSCAD
jgi:hypothetical protein